MHLKVNVVVVAVLLAQLVAQEGEAAANRRHGLPVLVRRDVGDQAGPEHQRHALDGLGGHEEDVVAHAAQLQGCQVFFRGAFLLLAWRPSLLLLLHVGKAQRKSGASG